MIDIDLLCEDLLEEETQHYYHKTFERHLADQDRFKYSTDMRFNEKMANVYIMFMESLHHGKGALSGENFILENWQKAAIGIQVGWERKGRSGKWLRRFNIALWFMARKNGKSMLASGLALTDSIIRKEGGGEIWAAATKREQAKIVWEGILDMMMRHPDLKEHTHQAYSTITFNPSKTTFKTLGRDSKNEDGFSATVGIVDEYHAHPTNDLYNIIVSSQGAREQPLMLIITTAGFNLHSPLMPEYEHAKQILDGVIEDDSYFAFIAEPDLEKIENDSEYKFSIEAMEASNPNIGVSIYRDFLEGEAKNAKNRPELLNNYLVKHLNLWVAQTTIFIPLDKWKACKVDETPDLSKALFKFIGIDISLNDDFTSKSVLYMFSNNEFYVETHHYIPADNIRDRARTLRVPLEVWVEKGYITATRGDTIDLDYIYKDIEKDLDTDIPCEFGYDPYRAKQLVSKIENDLGFHGCVPIRQGFLSISEPTKMLLDVVKRGELKYKNNPCTNWHISNMTILQDPAGNIKPDKASNRERKIDGAAAIIDSLALAIPHIEEEEQTLFTSF